MAIDSGIVLARVVAACEAAAGWSESPVLPMVFVAQATRPQAHMTFAVELGAVAIPDGDRQRLSIPVRQAVIVRWSYRIRKQAQTADYQAALTAEQALVAALRGITGTGGPSVTIDGITRAAVGAGTYLVGTITAVAAHQYPLT